MQENAVHAACGYHELGSALTPRLMSLILKLQLVNTTKSRFCCQSKCVNGGDCSQAIEKNRAARRVLRFHVIARDKSLRESKLEEELAWVYRDMVCGVKGHNTPGQLTNCAKRARSAVEDWRKGYMPADTMVPEPSGKSSDRHDQAKEVVGPPRAMASQRAGTFEDMARKAVRRDEIVRLGMMADDEIMDLRKQLVQCRLTEQLHKTTKPANHVFQVQNSTSSDAIWPRSFRKASTNENDFNVPRARTVLKPKIHRGEEEKKAAEVDWARLLRPVVPEATTPASTLFAAPKRGDIDEARYRVKQRMSPHPLRETSNINQPRMPHLSPSVETPVRVEAYRRRTPKVATRTPKIKFEGRTEVNHKEALDHESDWEDEEEIPNGFRLRERESWLSTPRLKATAPKFEVEDNKKVPFGFTVRKKEY